MPVEAKAPKDQARDAYGFEVKKEYLDLHKRYAPLWAKEEQERCKLWKDYLNSLQPSEAIDGASDGIGPGAVAEDFNSKGLEREFLKREALGQQAEEEPWFQQLKTLAQAGIPMDLRGKLWRLFLQGNEKKDPDVYDSLVSQALSPQYQNSKKLGEPRPFIKPHHLKGNSGRLDISNVPEDHLPNGHAAPDIGLAKQETVPTSGYTDWNAQIEKDLHRTFPGHPVMDKSGRRSLRRILSAYACRNPSVGYCQGMNFVAGCLLLFMEEEDAFWCLAVIVEQLLPGYFDTTMAASQVDQLVFKSLIEGQFPRLSAHLDKLGVNAISVSTQWFLCIFVNSLPLETCLRVWDIFFLEKCCSVLYRVALALIDIYAQALIATVDTIDAFILLQNMAPLSYDSSRLVDVACIAFATVDKEHMGQLRSSFEGDVNARIQERLARTKSQGGRYEGKRRSTSGSETGMESTDQALPYGLTPDRASLSINTSKAAQTAYQIASQPASAKELDSKGTSGKQHRTTFSEISIFSEEDFDREGLVQHVKDILDKRKNWLSGPDQSQDVQEMRVIHLKTLFARLEDEQFKADAEDYEFKINEQLQVEAEERLVADIRQTQLGIEQKQSSFVELEQRRTREARAVASGQKQVEHLRAVLTRATAHRELKKSLLHEKQELIKSLQQEMQQAAGKPSTGLLSAFRSFSLRRPPKS